MYGWVFGSWGAPIIPEEIQLALTCVYEVLQPVCLSGTVAESGGNIISTLGADNDGYPLCRCVGSPYPAIFGRQPHNHLLHGQR